MSRPDWASSWSPRSWWDRWSDCRWKDRLEKEGGKEGRWQVRRGTSDWWKDGRGQTNKYSQWMTSNGEKKRTQNRGQLEFMLLEFIFLYKKYQIKQEFISLENKIMVRMLQKWFINKIKAEETHQKRSKIVR